MIKVISSKDNTKDGFNSALVKLSRIQNVAKEDKSTYNKLKTILSICYSRLAQTQKRFDYLDKIYELTNHFGEY